MLVPLREAIRLTGLSNTTLRKFADNGTIKSKRIGRQRLFDVNSLIGTESSDERESIICYCRVSSKKQRDDLSRQVVSMQQQFPEGEIVQDIGSGLNFKRKGIQAILERILRGDKFTLIVSHRDRLCRFGFQLFEFLITKNGGKILVLNQDFSTKTEELTKDILAILHVFSCRMHGLRRYCKEIKEDTDLSK